MKMLQCSKPSIEVGRHSALVQSLLSANMIVLRPSALVQLVLNTNMVVLKNEVLVILSILNVYMQYMKQAQVYSSSVVPNKPFNQYGLVPTLSQTKSSLLEGHSPLSAPSFPQNSSKFQNKIMLFLALRGIQDFMSLCHQLPIAIVYSKTNSNLILCCTVLVKVTYRYL